MLILLSILLFIYSTQIFYKIHQTNLKRKHLRAGDVCKIYFGENKFTGFVLNVNDTIEVWVFNRVFQVDRNQIYS
jgi:hypothetical protein